MSIFQWYTRRAGGLSIVILLGLIFWSISAEWATSRRAILRKTGSTVQNFQYDTPPRNGGWWTITFAWYSLVIHCMVLVFPLRACWAVESLRHAIVKVARNADLHKMKIAHSRRLSSTSLSSAETLTPAFSTTSSEIGDIDMGESATDIGPDYERVVHAIIIPNYKEDSDGLRETLDVLASHPQACASYDVYLAMEMREQGAEVKAIGLVHEYIKKFHFIGFTLHPSDISGEAAGKSSNTGWAARTLSERYPIEQRKDVIITAIDADSHLSSNYFALVTNMHLEHPEVAHTTLYSAPILFDRNAHQVSAFVRVADILWCAAGLSGLYASSEIRPPTSVYSLPLELVDRVGGWDTDPESIGEDLHMYLKCFFALNGNLTSRTILAPVSQTNVSSGQLGYRGLVADVRDRYGQAMRHMWGALDTGYAMRQLVQVWRDRRRTVRSFRPLHAYRTNETDDYLLGPDFNIRDGKTPRDAFSDITHGTTGPPNWMKLLYLFHRLFEAHFLPTHMMILVLTSGLYTWVVAGKPDELGVAWLFTLTAYLRGIGFGCTFLYLVFYERYHAACANIRLEEMKSAGLAGHLTFSTRSFPRNLVDYAVFPIVAPLYGSIPAIQAQIKHFWTQDLTYAVSSKPAVQRLRQRAKSLVHEVLEA